MFGIPSILPNRVPFASCMWVYMSVSIFTWTDKDNFEPSCCNCCDDGFVRIKG